MIKINYQRQLDIINPDLIVFPITLIGLGGIGSPTALVLSKMGCPEMTLIDGDEFESHNQPSQIFFSSDLGEKKVEACKKVIESFSDCSVTAIPEMFCGQELSGVVISGVHDMDTRDAIWKYTKFNVNVPLYIDARIGGEIVEIFTVRPSQIKDIRFYEKFLFPEEEAAEFLCTAGAVIYVGFFIASFIASQFKKWLKKEEYYRRIAYDLKTMTHVYQE